MVGELNEKHVLIVDDMIDTAGTICNAAETAMENGALSVKAIATHAVLSGSSIDKLIKAPIESVLVTDTIYLPENKKFEKLEIMSVSETFGESIKRIVSGESLSSLFNNK